MARQLEKCDNNEFELLDPRTGDKIVFFYRSPETPDRVRHQSRRYGKKGNRLVTRVRSACIESAADILTGLRDEDFLIGKVPLSSTPGNPGYREDWKKVVLEMAGDLLLIMGHDLFERKISLEVLKEIDLIDEFDPEADGAVPGDDGEGEEIPPLAKPSGGSKKGARRSRKKSAPNTADPT